jgi:hypothetical protein
LEPLPNELFEVVSVSRPVQSDHSDTTKSHKEVTNAVTALNGADVVDVRDCNLDIFDMIEISNDTSNEVESKAAQRRNSRKGKHTRRRHSTSALEVPEIQSDVAVTEKRGRRHASGTERVRSKSSINARRRHSTGRETQELSASSSHRKSSKGSPNQYHRRRSENEPLHPARPSSRKSITKDESDGRPSSRKSIAKDDPEGKPSSYRARRKHHGRETNEFMDISRRKSTMT